MTKASKTVALVLVPLSIIYLGYRGCDHDSDGYASTRSSSGSGGRSFWGYRSGSSSSSGHSYSSGTSRGGFGFHGSSGS